MTHLQTRLLSAAALVLILAAPALAGPPLLCHPFDIGSATSLPWDGSNGWFQGRADYPVAQLVHDTEAILQPTTAVVVRMETLRRAAIYASRDTHVAQQLLDRLTSKVGKAGVRDALALSDAAYYIETLRQIGMLDKMTEFKDSAAGVRSVLGNADGVALMADALAARPGDPALEFEAALITSMRDRAASKEHAEKARAGAAKDTLLARNLDHLN
jgi:hypothetical protein